MSHGNSNRPVRTGQSSHQDPAANLPPAIANGIFDVLTAFAAGPQQDGRGQEAAVRIYGEAVAGFDPAVAEHAIGWLKLHNPRNPFRPTPQDVYETCEKLTQEWRERVLRHFTVKGSAPWGPVRTNAMGWPQSSHGVPSRLRRGAHP